MGNITIAQKVDTAKQPDMPESVIKSGYVDFVLSPEDIARESENINIWLYGWLTKTDRRRTKDE